jgi:hypothetical protein
MAAFMSSRWLLPEGLVVESLRREAGGIGVAARSPAGDGTCPFCGCRSRRVHSRYRRTPVDLPCSRRLMRISVIVRRFRCTKDLPGADRRRAPRRRDRGTLWAPDVPARLAGALSRSGLAVAPAPGSPLGSCCRSAATRCCAPCSAMPGGRKRQRRSWASTIGHGSAGSATAISSRPAPTAGGSRPASEAPISNDRPG